MHERVEGLDLVTKGDSLELGDDVRPIKVEDNDALIGLDGSDGWWWFLCRPPAFLLEPASDVLWKTSDDEVLPNQVDDKEKAGSHAEIFDRVRRIFGWTQSAGEDVERWKLVGYQGLQEIRRTSTVTDDVVHGQRDGHLGPLLALENPDTPERCPAEIECGSALYNFPLEEMGGV